MKDQMEVGTAFAAGYVQPRYTHHYNMSFAFSIVLYPQSQQIALRRSCPEGRNYGLTEFRPSNTIGLGVTCPPVVFVTAYPQCKEG